MRYGNKTNRFGSYGSQLNMEKHNAKKCFLGKYFNNFTFLLYLVAIAISMFLFTESASAQTGNLAGYVVQPGRIDVITRPRKSEQVDLRVHNFDPNNELNIEFKIIELTQKPTGDWWPFDIDPCSPFDYYPGLDVSKVSSCSSWIKMDKKSVTIPPDDDVIINVKINIPYNARTGFYGATIMASTRAQASESEKVPMVIRTGIPVVASVQLVQNVPSKVEIQDIGMEYIESEGPVPGKVLLTMKAKNVGVTFPRIKPIIRLRGFINNHWQLITTHEFDEMGIIPGIELELKGDIERSLPSAKYQLDALLYVDGQLRGSKTRLGKEIEFEGDPLKSNVNPDVPLDLDPQEIIISMMPGLRRIAHIKVHAAVSEKIEVVPIFDVPKSFKGKADGISKVEDALTCNKWLSFEPKKLTLEGFSTRNIAITAEMPENALKYPNYYAVLGLKVVYPDGQVAGTTWLNVCVNNQNAESQANVKCTLINLQETNKTNSEYMIQARFDNGGTTHIVPTTVKAAVVKADGFGRTSAMMSSDKAGMFMPYEQRYFTGFLNFSTLEPDVYNLEVLMDYPTKQEVKRQVRVRVRDVNGMRVPEVLDEEVKELIPVQWSQ
ncbi:MAG: hypothetical protein JXA96_13605 [Sedimentisphaerales bacterium]|nr:hypothetical protein [Sedimentisphaerales bacterium]